MSTRRSRRTALAASAAALALTVGGCAGGDFISAAEAEGIQVYEPELARIVVDDLCRNMDENDNMLGAFMTTSTTHANTPPSSTNDGRVFSLGVEYNCSQHSDAFNALTSGMGDGTFAPPPEAAVPPVVLPFGDQHTTPDGVTVSMTASILDGWVPTEQIPGDMVKLTIDVTNGTTGAIDPDTSGVAEVSSPDGGHTQTWALGSDEYDLVESQGDLLPGESSTFDTAVEMADSSTTLRIRVATVDDVYFEGIPTTGDVEPAAADRAAPTDAASESAAAEAEREATLNGSVSEDNACGPGLCGDEGEGTPDDDTYCADNPTDPMCMTDEEFRDYYGE